MTIDFQAVLAEFLFATKQLALPGIGTFNLQEKQPVILKDKKIIAPPSMELVFNPIESDHQNLVNFVSNKLGLDQKKVSSSFADWIKGLKNKLIKDQKVNIGTLGKLEMSKDGVANFIIGAHALEGFLQLPAIPAESIIYTEQSPPVLAREEIEAQAKTDKDKTIPMLLLAILLLALLWLLTWPLLFPPESINSTITDKTPIVDNRTNLDPQNDSALAGIGIMDDEKDGGVKDDDVDEKTADSILGDEVVMNEKIPDEKTENEEIGNEEIDEEKYTEEVITENSPEVEKVFQKECIIILGSFTYQSNAKKMMGKIKDEGYIPYTEMHNGNQRVGIRFDCLTRDLYSQLDQMRGDYTKDAWVLKYK